MGGGRGSCGVLWTRKLLGLFTDLVRSRQFSWWQSTRVQAADTHHNQQSSCWTRVGRLRHTFAYTTMTNTIWETGDNCISLILTDVNTIHTWGGSKKFGKHRVGSCLAYIYYYILYNKIYYLNILNNIIYILKSTGNKKTCFYSTVQEERKG